MAEREIEEAGTGRRGTSSAAARYPIPPIRGTHTRRFFPALGLTLVAWAVAWPFLTLGFLNRSDSPDAEWIHRLYERKDVALRRTDHTGRPRLVVVGGSGALFGVDAELIGRRLHVDAINDATHAGLYTYVLRRARSVVRPGDSVLLCPEYETWWQPDVSDIEWAYAITYDKRFVWRSGVADGLRSLYSVPGGDYWLSLCAWRNRLAGREAESAYGVATVDPAGDLRVSVKPKRFVVPAECNLPDAAACPPGPMQAFRTFAQWAKANRVRVFFSWPNMSRPNSAPPPALPPEVRDLFDRWGFIPLDAPAETCYPRDWFFDTCYHLNGGGRRVRTEALIRRLAPYYGRQPGAPGDPRGIYLVGPETRWLRDGNAFDNRPGVVAKYLVPQATDVPDAITPEQLAALARHGLPVYCDDPAVRAMLPPAQWAAREVDRDDASIGAWMKHYDRHLFILARSGAPAGPRPLGEDVPAEVRNAMNAGTAAWAILGTGPWRTVLKAAARAKGVDLRTTLSKLVGGRIPQLELRAVAWSGRSSIQVDGRPAAAADDGEISVAVFEPEQGILVDAATFPGGGTKTVWSMKQLVPRPGSSAAQGR